MVSKQLQRGRPLSALGKTTLVALVVNTLAVIAGIGATVQTLQHRVVRLALRIAHFEQESRVVLSQARVERVERLPAGGRHLSSNRKRRRAEEECDDAVSGGEHDASGYSGCGRSVAGHSAWARLVPPVGQLVHLRREIRPGDALSAVASGALPVEAPASDVHLA